MAFVYTGGATEGSNSSPTADITHGLTINEGDLVVVYINSNNPSDPVDSVGGGAPWNDAVNEVPAGETARQALFWKAAGASEPATYSFDLGATTFYRAIVMVWGCDGTPVVDAPATTYVFTTTSTINYRLNAIDGAVISDNALSVVAGGKDNRSTGASPAASADRGFVSPEGSAANQSAVAAHRIFTTGETFSGFVTMTTGLAQNDRDYSAHISFIEDAGGGAALAGDMSGTATLSGTLSTGATLAGDMSGTATLSGTLSTGVRLSGDATGAATLLGLLTIPADQLAGDMDGTATLSGTLSTGATLAGDMSGTATLVGGLAVPADQLAGDMTGSATLVGLLTVPADSLQGSATGTATLSGTLSTGVRLSGDMDGTAALVGDLVVPADALQGDMTGTATLVGLLTVPADTLRGDMTGTATLSGTLSTGVRLSGDMSGTAVLTGRFLMALGWESALQKAILDALTGSGDLAAIVTGVYDNVPQKDSAYPYVTIGEATHREFDTDTELGIDANVTIHVWSRYRGRGETKAIQNQVYRALHRADLAVTGYNFITSDFNSSQTFVDSDGLTRHGVQEFRVLIDEQ